MSELFKIRKNKSQKEIHANPHKIRKTPSPSLTNQHLLKQRFISNQHTHKANHLQPLLKTKTSMYHSNQKSPELRLDYTQPVQQKTSLSKQEVRYEGIHHLPSDINLPLRPSHADKQNRPSQGDKQNRPASINEVKYPVIAKVQSSLLKTDKFQFLKVYDVAEGLAKTRSDQDNSLEGKFKTLLPNKIEKVNLLKTTSRSKLTKKCGKPLAHDSQIVLNAELETEPDLHSYRTYRKVIINKIFCPSSKNAVNELKIISQQKQGNEDHDKFSIPAIRSKNTERSTERGTIEPISISSPVMKKDLNIFQANCSTIKEQKDSCSSFISKGGIEDLINTQTNMSEPSPFLEHRTCHDRRSKAQADTLKKKFPQNFFK